MSKKKNQCPNLACVLISTKGILLTDEVLCQINDHIYRHVLDTLKENVSHEIPFGRMVCPFSFVKQSLGKHLFRYIKVFFFLVCHKFDIMST